MKVTNAEAIKSGEKGLIEQITRDLDWGQVAAILEEKYKLKLNDGQATYRQGDIVVHNNQVAYQLEFDVTVTLSLMFDRQGECFDVITRPSGQPEEDEAPEPEAEAAATPAPEESAEIPDEPEEPGAGSSDDTRSDLASDIADMIADINKD